MPTLRPEGCTVSSHDLKPTGKDDPATGPQAEKAGEGPAPLVARQDPALAGRRLPTKARRPADVLALQRAVGNRATQRLSGGGPRQQEVGQMPQLPRPQAVQRAKAPEPEVIGHIRERLKGTSGDEYLAEDIKELMERNRLDVLKEKQVDPKGDRYGAPAIHGLAGRLLTAKLYELGAKMFEAAYLLDKARGDFALDAAKTYRQVGDFAESRRMYQQAAQALAPPPARQRRSASAGGPRKSRPGTSSPF